LLFQILGQGRAHAAMVAELLEAAAGPPPLRLALPPLPPRAEPLALPPPPPRPLLLPAPPASPPLLLHLEAESAAAAVVQEA
jgi:hypothetical protein